MHIIEVSLLNFHNWLVYYGLSGLWVFSSPSFCNVSCMKCKTWTFLPKINILTSKHYKKHEETRASNYRTQTFSSFFILLITSTCLMESNYLMHVPQNITIIIDILWLLQKSRLMKKKHSTCFSSLTQSIHFFVVLTPISIYIHTLPSLLKTCLHF